MEIENEIPLVEISKPVKRSTQLVGILVLLISFFVIPLLVRLFLYFAFGIRHTGIITLWASRFSFWFCLLFAMFYASRFEKQPLLLWEEKKYKVHFYILSVIAIFIALFAGLFFIGMTLKAAGFNNDSALFDKLMVIFRANKLLVVFTAITAGVVEELTFRGYILTRLVAITKSPVAAILISSVLFGLLHFGYGTTIQVVAPFFIGLVFAFHYWEFRNIKVLIFCHVAWDIMAIYAKM